MPKPKTLTEADLYEPIARHLDELGYTVRAEVMDCDITATRGDELDYANWLDVRLVP